VKLYVAILFGIWVLAFMCLGFWRARGLAVGLRLASACVPPLAAAGGLVTLLALSLCGVGDDFTVAQLSACHTATSFAEPVSLIYLGAVGVAWVVVLLLRGNRRARKVWLGVSYAITIIAPIVVTAFFIAVYPPSY
jgi:hypothetical protein